MNHFFVILEETNRIYFMEFFLGQGLATHSYNIRPIINEQKLTNSLELLTARPVNNLNN